MQHSEPNLQSALLLHAHSLHTPSLQHSPAVQSFALPHAHFPQVPFPRQHWPAVQSAFRVHAHGPQEPSAPQHSPALQSVFAAQPHAPHLPSGWQQLPAVQSFRLEHGHSPHFPSAPQHWPARQSCVPAHLHAPHLPSALQHSPAEQSCLPEQAQGPQTPPAPQHWPAVHCALVVQPHGPHAPLTPQHSPARQSVAAVHLHGPHWPSAPQHWPAVQSLFAEQPHSPHLPSAPQHWPARHESFEVHEQGPQVPPLQHSPARQAALLVHAQGLQRLSSPQHSPARQSAAARQHGWQVWSAAQQVPAPHSASLQQVAAAQNTLATGSGPASGGLADDVAQAAPRESRTRVGRERSIGSVQTGLNRFVARERVFFFRRYAHAALLPLLFSCVLAATPPEKEADAHFKKGVSLSARGDYVASLAEFEAAYRLAPAWQVLFNLGVVREKLDEPVPALEAFEAYLAEGGAKVPADRLKMVEQELQTLRKQVGELVVNVEGERAELEVDGLTRAAAKVYVLPGKHSVVARRDGESARAEVVVHRGERVVVALVVPVPAPVAEPAPVVLTPRVEPVMPAVAPQPVVVARETAAPWYGRWYVWTAVGVVVAGAVSAGVAVAVTRPKFDVRIDTP